MLFKYDLYPAEMLKTIIDAERKGEDVLDGIKRMLTALVINDTEDVPDSFIGIATAMLERAKQRSETYRRNAKMRDYSQGNARQNVEDTEDVAEEGEEEKPVQNAGKQAKVAIDANGFVRVTEREYETLIGKYGEDLPEMVEILSAYKESTGKKYRSDAGALRGWVRREFDERKRKQGAKSFKQMERERDASVVGSMLTDEQRRQYGI